MRNPKSGHGFEIEPGSKNVGCKHVLVFNIDLVSVIKCVLTETLHVVNDWECSKLRGAHVLLMWP